MKRASELPFWTQRTFWGLFTQFHCTSLKVAPASRRWRTRSPRGGRFVLVHPSQHSTVLCPGFLCNSKWEWGAEGLWVLWICHPGGSKNQILPQGPRLQWEATSGSAPILTSSASISCMYSFPRISQMKGTRNPFMGTE